MRAVAHGWKPDRMKGPPKKVAKEFVAADKKAKGYQYGGMFKKLLAEATDKRTPEERFSERYGTEPMTLKQAKKRASGSGGLGRTIKALRDLQAAGWSPVSKDDDALWYPREETATAPGQGGLAAAAEPVRTIDPVAGREFIAGSAPPRRAAPAGPAFDPGRVPVALQNYLTKMRAAAAEQPVKMQMGGALNFLRQGRVPPMQQAQRGQPPGGGMGIDMGMQKFLRRGQVPGGGQPPGGGVPMRGVGRPPGMGRPGGGGSDYQRMLQQRQQQATAPGAGGARPDVMPGRQFMPTPGGGGPTAGSPFKPEGIPFNPTGGGGAGMPGGGFGGRGRGQNLRGLMQRMQQQRMQQQQTGGGRPRIGSGDQQGALARASQVQTGRPPISRRQAFPGRGGRSRSRGRFQR